mmetsp:Transcript_33908/g.86941  ORF Transcript_33908/g.86941 Transcript_33908/m.86941 type:complete len:301 (-) Transcript_33908:71-973(-)
MQPVRGVVPFCCAPSAGGAAATRFMRYAPRARLFSTKPVGGWPGQGGQSLWQAAGRLSLTAPGSRGRRAGSTTPSGLATMQPANWRTPLRSRATAGWWSPGSLVLYARSTRPACWRTSRPLCCRSPRCSRTRVRPASCSPSPRSRSTTPSCCRTRTPLRWREQRCSRSEPQSASSTQSSDSRGLHAHSTSTSCVQTIPRRRSPIPRCSHSVQPKSSSWMRRRRVLRAGSTRSACRPTSRRRSRMRSRRCSHRALLWSTLSWGIHVLCDRSTRPSYRPTIQPIRWKSPRCSRSVEAKWTWL